MKSIKSNHKYRNIKILLQVLFFAIVNCTNALCQKKVVQEKGAVDSSDIRPLTSEQFNESVRKDFSTLIGAENKSIQNSLITSFDKKEFTLTGKWVKPLQKPSKQFKHLLSGEAKVGTKGSLLDFKKLDMPVLELTMQYNYIVKKKWFYNYKSTVEKNRNNSKITVWKEENRKDSMSYYYRIDSIKEKKVDTIWTAKRYLWFSCGMSYNNEKYKLYDMSRSIAQRIYDTTYNSCSANIGANYFQYWNHTEYEWRKRKLYYIYGTVNYQYKKGNNIDKLEKVDVNVINRDTITNKERSFTRTSKAFEGNYSTSLQHKVSGEVLFGITKTISIDLFGSILFSKSQTTPTGGIGLYFLAKDKENIPKINFGIFASKESTKPFTIGLKTSLPITL
jgi:hypothetical protein